jgi:hypothetical protein
MTTTSFTRDIGNPDRDILGPALWVPIILFFIGSLAAFHWCGFKHVHIQWYRHGQEFWPLLSIYLISKGGHIHVGQVILNALFQNTVIAISAMMLTYASATVGRPLIDGQLLSADQFIGYDWKAYASFIAHQDMIARIITTSYHFIFVLPFVVIVSLAVTKNIQTLEKFILAGLISLVITAALFSLFPATTAWTYLGLSDAEVSSFRYLTLSSDNWINELIRVREGDVRNLRDLQGLGLTGFPSFHCTAALLFIWATWKVRWIRVPVILADLLMLSATPISGGHYVADLIAGAVVMAAGVIIAHRLHAAMRSFQRAGFPPKREGFELGGKSVH